MPRQESESEHIFVVTHCDIEIGVGLAVPMAIRQMVSFKCAFFNPTIGTPSGINLAVGARSSGEPKMTNEWTIIRTGNCYRKSFAQFIGLQSAGIEKSYLPGAEIQLNAIVF